VNRNISVDRPPLAWPRQGRQMPILAVSLIATT
jgi:hypothetical protein